MIKTQGESSFKSLPIISTLLRIRFVPANFDPTNLLDTYGLRGFPRAKALENWDEANRRLGSRCVSRWVQQDASDSIFMGIQGYAVGKPMVKGNQWGGGIGGVPLDSHDIWQVCFFWDKKMEFSDRTWQWMIFSWSSEIHLEFVKVVECLLIAILNYWRVKLKTWSNMIKPTSLARPIIFHRQKKSCSHPCHPKPQELGSFMEGKLSSYDSHWGIGTSMKNWVSPTSCHIPSKCLTEFV